MVNMKNPRTTYFAAMAAVGAFLWDLVSVPYWVNVTGKCMVIFGTFCAGTAAADGRRVQEHADQIKQLKADTETKTR